MSKLIKGESETGRLHIDSPLMGESLVSKEFLKGTEAQEYFRMQPDINVIKIGGQSIIDRGAKATVLPHPKGDIPPAMCARTNVPPCLCRD